MRSPPWIWFPTSGPCRCGTGATATARCAIAPPRRTITNAFELGYKGIVREGLFVELDVYHHRLSDLLGGLFAATPSVFLDVESLAAYLTEFLPPEAAAQVAAGAAQIPLGTVTSAGFTSPDILVMRRQGGAVTFWGADVAVSADLTPEISAAASFSWVSDDSIPGVPGLDAFIPGVPVRKGTLAIAWRDAERGLSARLEGRAVASFPVQSGVYQGRVAGYEVLDLYAGWRLPWAPSIDFSLEVQNLLGDRHREYVGAPEIGRLAVGRLRVAL
jgi:iron complex outermembrane receptor protein